MNPSIRSLAAAAVATFAFAIPMSHAQSMDPGFMKQTDTNRDGMVSKQEAMQMFEKMFDKADTKKEGKLDDKQFESFLKSVIAASMGS
jgi:hypothetical protein